ncbi:MAG TPA: hypothetical protein VGM88_11820 [Kofleriaceae bacterium]|jgi:hypothetical protein
MRCTITRWQLSNALDRGDLSSRASRGHASTCPDCRAFATRLQALHAQLSLGADRAPAPRAAPRNRFVLPAFGLLAAGAATAVLVVSLHHPAPIASPPVAFTEPPSLPVAELATTATHAALHVDQPLDHELDAIVADGKSGFAAVLATGGL